MFDLITVLIKDFGDKGLELGSEVSQILALYYPDKVDRYIKEQLRVKYYGRYMDDGYLIHHDKEYLKEVKDNIFRIAKTLDIRMNEKKTFIHKIDQGVIWLKIRYTLGETGKIYKRPNKQNIVRMRRKLKKYKKNNVSMENIKQSYTS